MKYIEIVIIVFLLSSFIANGQERTISAGGSITEIMYEFGLADEIIAVDSSSFYPLDATKKPQVGYFRQLSAEGVLSLNPTRIIVSNGAGPDEALNQIERSGVEVKVFKQEVYDFESWKTYVREIGEYFKLPVKAEAIINRVNRQLDEMGRLNVESKHDNLKKTKPTAIFLMDLGDRGPVAAGDNTVPDMLFELAGIENIVTDYEGFKPYSSEQLIQFKPDMVVMPSHVVKKLGGQEMICQNRLIQLTTIDSKCNILVMDGLLALGFGTRIDQAVELLLDNLSASNAHES